MTTLTQEEIRDEVLSLFEENEQKLLTLTSQIEKIENEGVISFEKKVLAAKNNLVQDVTVLDEDLEKKYVEDVEKIRSDILEKVEHQIKELIETERV